MQVPWGRVGRIPAPRMLCAPPPALPRDLPATFMVLQRQPLPQAPGLWRGAWSRDRWVGSLLLPGCRLTSRSWHASLARGTEPPFHCPEGIT